MKRSIHIVNFLDKLSINHVLCKPLLEVLMTSCILILVCNKDAAHKLLGFTWKAFRLTLVFVALKMLESLALVTNEG
jgi:hypothetical protein